MFKVRNKFFLLCIALALTAFLVSCENVSEEVDYPVDLELSYVENDVSDISDIASEHEQAAQVIVTYDERITLQILLDAANEHRLGIEKVDVETVTELAYSREFVLYDRTILLRGFTERLRVLTNFTQEEAIEDVEVLFEVLRYIYGPYQYFGGDDIFEPARERIIEDIQNDHNISSTTFLMAIYRHLSPIITDNHISIGHLRFGPEYKFLVNRETFFDRTSQGFYNRENGLYIEEIEGHNISELMRLQLDEYGQHFYGPVLQGEAASASSQTITIVYEDGTIEQLELQEAPINRNIFQSPSYLMYVDGFPVVSLSRMMHMNEASMGEYAHNFLNYATELRDEPVVILDLRSNSGGTPHLPSMWMYLLTGEVVNGNSVQLINWNVEYEYVWSPWDDMLIDPLYFSAKNFEYLKPIHTEPTIINGYIINNLSDRNIVEREQLLIILVNRYTTSSGEHFVDLAFNVENTIIIGQNTDGNLISDRMYPYLRMPNTNTIISLGIGVHLWPEEHFSEGAGIAPNVWVTGCALTATIAMLTND